MYAVVFPLTVIRHCEIVLLPFTVVPSAPTIVFNFYPKETRTVRMARKWIVSIDTILNSFLQQGDRAILGGYIC
jgi:hypothetical protein